MSALAHDFYAASGMMWLPIGALALFIALFSVQALRTLLHRSKAVDDHMAALPLDDEPAPTRAVDGASQQGGDHA